MIAAHQTMLAPPALPYDAEVEYLESTGTQYVDTGVVGASSVDMEIDLSLPASKIIGALARNPVVRYHIGRESNGSWSVYLAGAVQFNATPPSPDGLISVAVHPSIGQCVIGGTTVTKTVESFDTGRNIYLFARNDANGIAYVSGKTASCKLWSNGTLVRDFVPVRVGQTGYLYDRVSGQLFGNAGTGDFVLGPDK